ncbi:MAG: hypothetical protein FWF59_00705 [Turicibacter sp.]|nr:hypothetical protein [Turicibacter sp.]
MKKGFTKLCAVTGASLFGVGALGGTRNGIEAQAASPVSSGVEATEELNFSPELLEIFEEVGIQPFSAQVSAWREMPAGLNASNGIFRAADTFSWDREFTGRVCLVNGNTEIAGSRAQANNTTTVRGAFVDTRSSTAQARGSISAR